MTQMLKLEWTMQEGSPKTWNGCPKWVPRLAGANAGENVKQSVLSV